MQRTMAYLDSGPLVSDLGIDWDQWGVIENLDSNIADLGDYGYVELSKYRNVTKFVRLGHITDVLQNDPRYVNDSAIYTRSPDLATSTRFRLPLNCPTRFTPTIAVMTWCMRVFWDNLLHLATLHGIPAYRIVIVSEKEFVTGIINRCGDLARCSSDRVHYQPRDMFTDDTSRRITCVYYEESSGAAGSSNSGRGVVDAFFHCIIRDEDLIRRTPSRWGYWSFIAEPSPAPWPNVAQLDRIFTICRSGYKYRRLSRVEVELYNYCVQLRNSMPVK